MREKLQKILKQKLAMEIVKFFYENQASIDSVGGVSTWVQTGRQEVRDMLEALVDLGVLKKDSTGGTEGYCYTGDKKTMKIVEELMENDQSTG